MAERITTNSNVVPNQKVVSLAGPGSKISYSYRWHRSTYSDNRYFKRNSLEKTAYPSCLSTTTIYLSHRHRQVFLLLVSECCTVLSVLHPILLVHISRHLWGTCGLIQRCLVGYESPGLRYESMTY